MATSPIILTSPGFTPDVRLMVLGISEFHVDSVHLKMHSAFFRKFLDSADKGTPVAGDRFGSACHGTVHFRYEWVTQIDEDGKGWHLVEKSKAVAKLEDLSLFQGDAKEQTLAFEKMLNAMYLQPYSIFGPHELEVLTSLADYYCALQIISRTLMGNLVGSSFIYMLPLNLDEDGLHSAMASAVTLRNSVLFKDLLVLCVGDWDTCRVEELQNEKVRELASDRRQQLADWVITTHERLLNLSAEPVRRAEDRISERNVREARRAERQTIIKETGPQIYKESEDDFVSIPQYFRRLWDTRGNENDFPLREISDSMSLLMENHLTAVPGARGGESDSVFKEHFLGARVDDISDEDLPWDTKQTDW